MFEELPDIHTFEINAVIAGDKEIKNDPDLHWDRIQEQTLQGSHHQTGHEILHTFITIQTRKQWED